MFLPASEQANLSATSKAFSLMPPRFYFSVTRAAKLIATSAEMTEAIARNAFLASRAFFKPQAFGSATLDYIFNLHPIEVKNWRSTGARYSLSWVR